MLEIPPPADRAPIVTFFRGPVLSPSAVYPTSLAGAFFSRAHSRNRAIRQYAIITTCASAPPASNPRTPCCSPNGRVDDARGSRKGLSRRIRRRSAPDAERSKSPACNYGARPQLCWQPFAIGPTAPSCGITERSAEWRCAEVFTRGSQLRWS